MGLLNQAMELLNLHMAEEVAAVEEVVDTGVVAMEVMAVNMVEEATEAAANLPITACDSNLKHFSTFILF